MNEYTQGRLQAPPDAKALDLLETAQRTAERARRIEAIGKPDVETLLSELYICGEAVKQALAILRHEVKP